MPQILFLYPLYNGDDQVLSHVARLAALCNPVQAYASRDINKPTLLRCTHTEWRPRSAANTRLVLTHNATLLPSASLDSVHTVSHNSVEK